MVYGAEDLRFAGRGSEAPFGEVWPGVARAQFRSLHLLLPSSQVYLPRQG